MSHETEKSVNNITEKLADQFAADKKKGILAICLLLVMVFMWIKMLGNKAPQSADAALTIESQNDPKSDTAISFKKLPDIEGRNDVLTRDFFSSDNWNSFIGSSQRWNGGEEITQVGSDTSKGSMQRLAEKLKLEAIGLGDTPQAFINNKLLSEGDKIIVEDGSNTYECEVIEIKENTVIVKYKESEIVLKLTQTTATSAN